MTNLRLRGKRSFNKVVKNIKNITFREILSHIFPLLLWIILVAWTIFFLTLIGWAFITSIKTSVDMYYNPVGLPKKQFGGISLVNYKTAVNAVKVIVNGRNIMIPELFFNSIMYSLVTPFFGIFGCALMSYVYVKFNSICPWLKIVWVIVLITLYLPINGGTAATIRFLTTFHIRDNWIGWSFYSAGGFGSTFLYFMASWKGISNDYIDAASIDGAGYLRIFFSIMLPMIAGIYGVLTLTTFITCWNDFLTPMIYLSSHPTLGYAIWKFQYDVTGSVSDITVRLAGMITTSLPILILFVIFKEQLLVSLTVGGLKG